MTPILATLPPVSASLNVACPRCGAKPMERCRLLSGPLRNGRWHTDFPHTSRRVAAGAA